MKFKKYLQNCLKAYYTAVKRLSMREKLRGGGKLSHVGPFNTKNFFSEGQKNLVNSENKENLSNYQLLKRKSSVCSTSLHFSKLITVVQFFFA